VTLIQGGYIAAITQRS